MIVICRLHFEVGSVSAASAYQIHWQATVLQPVWHVGVCENGRNVDITVCAVRQSGQDVGGQAELGDASPVPETRSAMQPRVLQEIVARQDGFLENSNRLRSQKMCRCGQHSPVSSYLLVYSNGGIWMHL